MGVFANRVAQLGAPYGSHKSGAAPRLDLRDVVPNFGDLCAYSAYPDTADLRRVLANKMALDENAVHITAGGDGALFQLILATIEPGTNLVISTPTFAMTRRYVTIAGGDMRTVAWMAGDFPVADFLAQIDADTRVILFVSPNNPTGQTIPFSVIQQIRAAAPGAWMILDAVYMEFANVDITFDFLNLPRTLVIRSFSKAHGAAGLRVGYAISRTPELLSAMRGVAQPYGISTPSIVAVMTLLNQQDSFTAAVETIKQNRAELFSALASAGYSPLPSEANFIFLPCESAAAAQSLIDNLGRAGIAVRNYPDDPSLANCLRIGVSYARADLELLINAITKKTP